MRHILVIFVAIVSMFPALSAQAQVRRQLGNVTTDCLDKHPAAAIYGIFNEQNVLQSLEMVGKKYYSGTVHELFSETQWGPGTKIQLLEGFDARKGGKVAFRIRNDVWWDTDEFVMYLGVDSDGQWKLSMNGREIKLISVNFNGGTFPDNVKIE